MSTNIAFNLAPELTLVKLACLVYRMKIGKKKFWSYGHFHLFLGEKAW